jgi:hypothetical protein
MVAPRRKATLGCADDPEAFELHPRKFCALDNCSDCAAGHFYFLAPAKPMVSSGPNRVVCRRRDSNACRLGDANPEVCEVGGSQLGTTIQTDPLRPLG